jgi:ABC-2 type transport system permease protein
VIVATYVRYEVLRAFCNRRFFLFSLGFPLVLYFLIAAPIRNDHDFNGSGISAPLYFMVGIAAFGAMTAMLSSGARIAAERTIGWNRPLREVTACRAAYVGAAVTDIAVLRGELFGREVG